MTDTEVRQILPTRKVDNMLHEKVKSISKLQTKNEESEIKLASSLKSKARKNQRLKSPENEINNNDMPNIPENIDKINLSENDRMVKAENTITRGIDEKEVKKKNKKSTKKKKPKANQDEDIKDIFVDDGHVMQVIVHRSDKLKFNMMLSHPVISVSIIDANTGNYVKKLDKSRPVISKYESTNEKVDYIQPVLTSPFDFKRNQSIMPVWEDSILINEAFNHFIRPEAKVIIFFQLMDFVSPHYVNKHSQFQNGWFNIAWAFLQLVGANESENWGRKVRLQLYKVPVIQKNNNKSPEIFQWWLSDLRTAYPSTLYVTINKVKVINEVAPSLRSLFPLQEEASLQRFVDESRSNLSLADHDDDALTPSHLITWSRLPGQSCQIPQTLHKVLPSALKGCTFVKFSKGGRFLACGCQDIDGFPLIVYEVPSFKLLMTLKGHQGIIYDISWMKDNRHILSASADGSVRIWSIETQDIKTSAFHPSFLYAAQIEPIENKILITGCYDRLIRVWSITLSTNHDGYLESNTSKLLQELNLHETYVNVVCFHTSGKLFYSGDGDGCVMVWMVDAQKNHKAPVTFHKEMKIDGTKSFPITSLDVHPLGHKLLVQSRNNKLQIVDLRVEAVMHKLLGPVNIESKLKSCFSPDGSLVFSGSEDGRVYSWSTESGNHLFTYNNLNYTMPVCCLDSHPLDDYIAFCCHDYNQPIKIYKYDLSASAVNIPREGWKEQEMNAMLASETNYDLLSMAKSSVDKFDFSHAMRIQTIKSKLFEVSSMHSLTPSNLTNFYGSSSANLHHPLSPSYISSYNSLAVIVPSSQPILTIAEKNDQDVKVVFKPSSTTSKREIVVATEDYSAQRSDELTFSKGDIIVVLHKDSESWWLGHMPASMKHGYFPANQVRPRLNVESSQTQVPVSRDEKMEGEVKNKQGSLLREKSSSFSSRRSSTGSSRNRVSFNLGRDDKERKSVEFETKDLTEKSVEHSPNIISSVSTVRRGSTNLQNLNSIPEEKQFNSIDASNMRLGASDIEQDKVHDEVPKVHSKPPVPVVTSRKGSVSQQRTLPSTFD